MTTYVYINTDVGSASPSTKKYTSPQNPAPTTEAWSRLSLAEADATIRAATDDLIFICTGATDDIAVTLSSNLLASSLTVQGDLNEAKWNPSKYTIANTGTGVGTLTTTFCGTNKNITIRNLQVDTNNTNVSSRGVYIFPSTGNGLITTANVISRISGSGTGGGVAFRHVTNSSYSWNAYNCIAYVYGTPGGLRDLFYGLVDTTNLYNCVAYGADATAGGGGTGFSVHASATNCVSFGNVLSDWDSSTVSYSASDDVKSGTGNINGLVWANQFIDYVNGDFRLKSDSSLVGAGLDDPASGLFSDDITGRTRNDWDIGAFEYAGLFITSVTPSSFDDGHTGIVIAGTGFGASQGTVKIGGVTQNVTAWGASSITFTAVRGATSLGSSRLDIYPA